MPPVWLGYTYTTFLSIGTHPFFFFPLNDIIILNTDFKSPNILIQTIICVSGFERQMHAQHV